MENIKSKIFYQNSQTLKKGNIMTNNINTLNITLFQRAFQKSLLIDYPYSTKTCTDIKNSFEKNHEKTQSKVKEQNFAVFQRDQSSNSK